MARADINGKYFLSYEHIHLSVRVLAERIRESEDAIVAHRTHGPFPRW